MSTPLSRLADAFQPNPDGVVGMVDGVLDVGREHEFRMTFDDGARAVSVVVGAETARVPVRKTVFRAALARVAALCDAPGRDEGSPYDGGGDIALPTNPPASVQVAFKNTPDAQHLSVSPRARGKAAEVSQEKVVAAVRQLVELYPPAERKALLVALLPAFGLGDAAKQIEVIVTAG